MMQNASATSRSANLSARVSNSANLTVVSRLGTDSTRCQRCFYKNVTERLSQRKVSTQKFLTSQQLLTWPARPQRKTSCDICSCQDSSGTSHLPTEFCEIRATCIRNHNNMKEKGPGRRFVSVILRKGIAAHLPLEGTPSLNYTNFTVQIKCM